MSGESPITLCFRSALADYLFLAERDYSRTSALKLVGDRYQLSSVQRTILYRGAVPAAVAELRRARRTLTARGEQVAVDCYNVLLTLTNYLCGRVLFVATDGYLRDAGEIHRDAHDAPMLERATQLLVDWLKVERPLAVYFYIDEPISHSGSLATVLRDRLADNGIPGGAETVKSPDYVLKDARTGIVATSDSAVIDRAQVPVLDVAHSVLLAEFNPDFIDLERIRKE